MATGEPYKIREEGTVGFAIIVANKFEGVNDMVRDGTHAEIKMLTEIFTKLGFEPKVFGEVTSSELLEKMNDIKDDPILKSHDMIALAICSHGKPGQILFPTQEVIDKAKEQKESEATGYSMYDANPPKGHGSGVESLSVEEIQESVMSEYLAGKPKLVILNACRWEKDADVARSVGDRFTLYSTNLGVKSTKFEFQDQGYIPIFLRKLYEVINNQNPHDAFNSIHERINDMYDKDKKMKTMYEERSDMELNGVNKILCLQLRTRLEDLNNLFKKNEERDSDFRSTRFSCSDNKNLTIPGTKCATSIAYNSKQPCYYICDPESSKIIVFLADFTEKREFLLDCRLEGPRYIQCISHEKFIFISHELGVARVDISDGKIESKHKAEPLEAKPIRDRVEDFISPCLAANEPHGILFILDRFSHNSDQKLRRIFVYNVAYREYNDEFIPVLRLQVLSEMKENYSPIITDMNFRQYNPEQQQLLILAYLPSPFLLIYTIGKKEFTVHPPFLLRKCEPCFIASYLNYALISSPKAEKSITKINDEKEDENEKCKLLNIKNTQAILLHAGEKAIITAIEGDNCVIYSWEGITK